MGLSAEESIERENALQKLKITTYENEDDGGYVFVSYKSDNWKKVFLEKIFALQELGLRVYCDKKFDETNLPWLEDMDSNIRYCSAFIMFISEEYLKSYATLIELLTAIKYEKEIVPVFFDDRKATLKKLKLDRKLVGEKVEMQQGEESCLKELIEGIDNREYSTVMANLAANYKNKITHQKLKVIDIVESFEKIFAAPYFNKDNAFSGSIDSLKKTIENAVSKAGCPSVFGEITPASVSIASAPQPERHRGRPPKNQSAQEVKTEAPKQSAQETKAEPSKQPENKKDGVGIGHSATGQLDYELYGKKETGDQGSMMTKVISTVLEKHPEKIDEAAARFNCLSLEDQMQKNKGDRPSYFRSGQTYEIAGRTVCVGTSYGMDMKLKLIAGIIAMTGEEPSAVLKIDNWPLPEVKSSRRDRSK